MRAVREGCAVRGAAVLTVRRRATARRRRRRGAARRAGGGGTAARRAARAGSGRAARGLHATHIGLLHAGAGAGAGGGYLRRCAARGASTSGGAGEAAGAAPSHGHVTPDTRSPAHTSRLYTLTTDCRPAPSAAGDAEPARALYRRRRLVDDGTFIETSSLELRRRLFFLMSIT